MRALSLSQPWASFVVSGPKRVENRENHSLASVARAMIGQRFAVHAAKSWNSSAQHRIIEAGFSCGMQVEHVAGAVLGVATITGVHRFDVAAGPAGVAGIIPDDQLRWTFGPWCLLLDQVAAIAEPVRCRGFMGFWPLPRDVEQRVLEQLEVAGG